MVSSNLLLHLQSLADLALHPQLEDLAPAQQDAAAPQLDELALLDRRVPILARSLMVIVSTKKTSRKSQLRRMMVKMKKNECACLTACLGETTKGLGYIKTYKIFNPNLGIP